MEKNRKIKVCPICGKSFLPENNNRKYCCDECSQKALEENKKKYLNRPDVKEKMKLQTQSDKFKEQQKQYRESHRKERSQSTVNWQLKVKALGMTVSQFKALGHTDEEIDRIFNDFLKQREMPVEKICPVCGKAFTVPYKYRGRVYCSAECRKKANKIKRREAYRKKNNRD